MDPTSGIQKLGFRKWYERELIKCHAALVTCFLCVILIAAMMEQLNVREFSLGLVTALVLVAASSVLGWASWRSYITILRRAERYGERSSCPQCNAYGRFKVIASGLDPIPGPAAAAVAPLESAWLRVECRQCGTTWRMPE